MIKQNYTAIIRFKNEGFDFKPYNSPDYSHIFGFIDSEIKDLDSVRQSIELSKVNSPQRNDPNWSGCFCFLEELDREILRSSGSLAMRRNDKVNIAAIPNNELIWVRNISHLGKKYPYYNEFSFSYVHEDKEYWSSNQCRSDYYRWVRMDVKSALKRTRLWKELNPNKPTPEWLTEFYLMENQYASLVHPSLKDKIYGVYYNTKLIIRNGTKIGQLQ